MRNAAYQVVGTTPGVVFLVDLDDGGRSVTNAAAEVVAEVLAGHPRLPDRLSRFHGRLGRAAPQGWGVLRVRAVARAGSGPELRGWIT